jgi:NitT/TauT family transport system ATP-binding protein
MTLAVSTIPEASGLPSPPSPSDVLVRLESVGKCFANGVVALTGVNLDVKRGEFLSLLGPSGCGKSTILRLLSKLTSATDGGIDWLQKNPELGFVFQEPTLMPWATVFDNVWLPLRLTGLSRNAARDRIEESLAKVGLKGFEKAYPRELSGGMKMRVSIARALVMRPAVLLMDEPFAALDEITRSRLNDDLVALKVELGATVVFVTHSVYESVYLSDRIVVMAPRPGRVVAEIVVPSPLPRGEDFRLSAEYADKCRATSHALHEAMASGAPGDPRAIEGARP